MLPDCYCALLSGLLICCNLKYFLLFNIMQCRCKLATVLTIVYGKYDKIVFSNMLYILSRVYLFNSKEKKECIILDIMLNGREVTFRVGIVFWKHVTCYCMQLYTFCEKSESVILMFLRWFLHYCWTCLRVSRAFA